MEPKVEIDLQGYKEKAKTDMKGFLFWEKDLLFRGMTQSGYEIEFDAAVQWGCMPTESLMLSLAGCMGIDAVSFLQKMKVELHKFKMDIDGLRNPAPPQYFKEITMHLHFTGKGIKGKAGGARHRPVSGQVLLRVPFIEKRPESKCRLYNYGYSRLSRAKSAGL